MKAYTTILSSVKPLRSVNMVAESIVTLSTPIRRYYNLTPLSHADLEDIARSVVRSYRPFRHCGGRRLIGF